MTRHFLTPRLMLENPAPKKLCFSRYDSLTRRLRILESAKLIRRDSCCFNRESSFCLTTPGAHVVESHLGEPVPPQAIKVTSLSQQLHAFEASRFWLKFLQDSDKLCMPVDAFWRDGSFVSTVNQRRLIPDGVAVLRIRGKSQVFCLELDRSTESGSTILTKYERYDRFIHRAKQHPQLEPFKLGAVRVVFVCQSPERMANLMRLAEGFAVKKHLRFILRSDFIKQKAEGYEPRHWEYRKSNLFTAPLFSHPGRSPPQGLL